jgi:hypothetical protein
MSNRIVFKKNVDGWILQNQQNDGFKLQYKETNRIAEKNVNG